MTVTTGQWHKIQRAIDDGDLAELISDMLDGCRRVGKP